MSARTEALALVGVLHARLDGDGARDAGDWRTIAQQAGALYRLALAQAKACQSTSGTLQCDRQAGHGGAHGATDPARGRCSWR